MQGSATGGILEGLLGGITSAMQQKQAIQLNDTLASQKLKQMLLQQSALNDQKQSIANRQIAAKVSEATQIGAAKDAQEVAKKQALLDHYQTLYPDKFKADPNLRMKMETELDKIKLPEQPESPQVGALITQGDFAGAFNAAQTEKGRQQVKDALNLAQTLHPERFPHPDVIQNGDVLHVYDKNNPAAGITAKIPLTPSSTSLGSSKGSVSSKAPLTQLPEGQQPQQIVLGSNGNKYLVPKPTKATKPTQDDADTQLKSLSHDLKAASDLGLTTEDPVVKTIQQKMGDALRSKHGGTGTIKGVPSFQEFMSK
ncbi:MAG: hypothetical protein HQM09_15220 [Candidatus Riflebacteria bacterium]|nr:hypothetical protein [Candidatus Riflebacteria bacterium]